MTFYLHQHRPNSCPLVSPDFHRFYYTPACEVQSDPTTPRRVASRTSQLLATVANSTGGKTPTELEDVLEGSVCRRETSLLFVLLMLGTRKCTAILRLINL